MTSDLLLLCALFVGSILSVTFPKPSILSREDIGPHFVKAMHHTFIPRSRLLLESDLLLTGDKNVTYQF